MRPEFRTLLLFLLWPGFFSLLSAQNISPKTKTFQLDPEAAFVPGVIRMKVKPEFRLWCTSDEINHPLMEKVLNELNVNVLRKAVPNAQPPSEPTNQFGQEMVDLSLTYELFFDPRTDVEWAVNMVLSAGILEYAEPQYTYELFYDPDDPDTGSQYYIPLMQLRQAWDISKGDTSVVVGIIDTGTSFTHPELDTKVHYNQADPIDGIDNDGNGYVDDYMGWDFGGELIIGTIPPEDNDPTWSGSDHGVLVTGPVSAEQDNGVCIASVGFNTHYLPVKVSSDGGDVIVQGYKGVIYAADRGCDIINCSWGGTQFSYFGQDAINYAAINKDAAIFVACGNTPTEVVFYPASFPNAISVAGTQGGDDVWRSDPTFGTSWSYLVDVCAPARNVRVPAGHNNCYGAATGTSLAAPIAAGVAALVKAENPGYTNLQVAQRVRVSTDDLYSQWASTYDEKMGTGRVNAYQALTDSSPAVRVLNLRFEDADGDGNLNPGEQVEIYGNFLNYLDPVKNLTISLESPQPTVIQVQNGSYFVGDLGTLDTSGTCLAPFKIQVMGTVSGDSRAFLKFKYEGDDYQDYEYWEVRLNPSYVTLRANDIEVSFNSTGNLGFQGYPQAARGAGFLYEGDLNFMGDAGFMIGTDASHVSDNILNSSGNARESDLERVDKVYKMAPGPYGDEEAHALFNDDGAAISSLGVEVAEHVYQFEDGPDGDYVIVEYVIKNTRSTSLSGAYAGIFADWEVGWWLVNQSHYHPGDRMISVFDYDVGTAFEYSGMALLTPDSLHAYATPKANFNYNTAEKWHSLSQVPDSAESGVTDIFQVISAGPLSIAPNDSHRVAFALFLGDSVPDLVDRKNAAYQKYWCLIRGMGMNAVDLGPDILHCNGDTAFVLDAGNGYSNYSWNTGGSGQTITVDSSGVYRVEVNNGAGCVDWDYIEVSIGEGISGSMLVSATNILAGDTVFFEDTSSFATKFYWDFGDGSTGNIFPSTYHVYNSPGVFTAMHTVSNGTCEDTLYEVITVDTLASRETAAALFAPKLFPNPTSGGARLQWDSPTSGTGSVVLFNTLGQPVWEKSIRKTNHVFELEIPSGELPAGIYPGRIRIGDSWQSFRLIRQ